MKEHNIVVFSKKEFSKISRYLRNRGQELKEGEILEVIDIPENCTLRDAKGNKFYSVSRDLLREATEEEEAKFLLERL